MCLPSINSYQEYCNSKREDWKSCQSPLSDNSQSYHVGLADGAAAVELAAVKLPSTRCSWFTVLFFFAFTHADVKRSACRALDVSCPGPPCRYPFWFRIRTKSENVGINSENSLSDFLIMFKIGVCISDRMKTPWWRRASDPWCQEIIYVYWLWMSIMHEYYARHRMK